MKRTTICLSIGFATLAVYIAAAADESTAGLAAEPPRGPQEKCEPQEKWILRTDDTRLVVGVSADHDQNRHTNFR